MPNNNPSLPHAPAKTIQIFVRDPNYHIRIIECVYNTTINDLLKKIATKFELSEQNIRQNFCFFTNGRVIELTPETLDKTLADYHISQESTIRMHYSLTCQTSATQISTNQTASFFYRATSLVKETAASFLSRSWLSL
jgi:hypothetical protein